MLVSEQVRIGGYRREQDWLMRDLEGKYSWNNRKLLKVFNTWQTKI